MADIQTLTLSTGSFDQQNTFNLVVTKKLHNRDISITKVCSLMRDYQTKEDGVYWALSAGSCLKAQYSDADRQEQARFKISTPIKNGDNVMIDGAIYRVRVLGDYSDAAIFEKG